MSLIKIDGVSKEEVFVSGKRKKVSDLTKEDIAALEKEYKGSSRKLEVKGAKVESKVKKGK